MSIEKEILTKININNDIIDKVIAAQNDLVIYISSHQSTFYRVYLKKIISSSLIMKPP